MRSIPTAREARTRASLFSRRTTCASTARRERHNAFASDPVQMRAGWALDREELYAQASAGPGDMDFVQTYDDYPVISLMQLEDLGFCGKGEAPAFVRRHSFTHDGSFPLNT